MTSVTPNSYSVKDLSSATVNEDGYFMITVPSATDPKKTDQVSMTFSKLLLAMGLHSLGITRGTFNTQFAIAQERVSAMKDLNDLVQAMNLYKNDFDADGDVTDTIKTRNGDLFETLLKGIDVIKDADGKTYTKNEKGEKDIGPLDFLTRTVDDHKMVETIETSFKDMKLSDFKLMLDQAELFLMLNDNDVVTRYKQLSLQVKKDLKLDSGTKKDPNGNTNEWHIPTTTELNKSTLSGDNLEFMKKICPLLQEAKDKHFEFIKWNPENGNRCYTILGDQEKEGEPWYVGSCFSLYDPGGNYLSKKAEAYKKLLNTPLQPSGFTLPEIYDITTKVKKESGRTSYMKGADLQKLKDFMKKYPNTLDVKVDDYKAFTQKELETFLSNCQTAQSTLSSLNDQQGTRTNQAMQRSSGMLQTLQTMLQAANQARNSAASTGAV